MLKFAKWEVIPAQTITITPAQTITLATATIVSARISLLSDANTYANRALEYIALGWHDCAANAALLAFRYSRAWHEIAFATK
jgi:hypothetical protein